MAQRYIQGFHRSLFGFGQAACLAMAANEDDDGMGVDEFLELLDEAQPGGPIHRRGQHQDRQEGGLQAAAFPQGPVRPGLMPGQPREQGRQRQRQGRGPGQGRGPRRGRWPGRQTAVQKNLLKRQRSADLQSDAFNASGRGRTKDHSQKLWLG